MQTHPRAAPTLETTLSVEDQRWFRAIGWDDARVAPIRSEAEAVAYARREAALNAAIAALTPPERGDSAEGRLAAALGAALANWRERDEEE
ncbi:MAG: hypothetical protein JNK46_10930 [Methylobacteriaceae bacterium]|nr:hypothetical protein [Methylobacteriaceae bacterium]